jgi:hypothetical protein
MPAASAKNSSSSVLAAQTMDELTDWTIWADKTLTF